MRSVWPILLLACPLSSRAAAEYKGGDVANAGSIRGVVRLTGPAPKAEEFRITKDNNVCGSQRTPEDLVTGVNNGVKDVVVSIERISTGKRADMAPASLDQKACRYEPRVQAVMVGAGLKILNSDPVLHNVHAYRQDRTTDFNVGMPFQGMKADRRLDRAAILDVRCDAGHTWMRAWIHVVDNPYFAVTLPDGSFSLEKVPPGKYKLRFWHERLGTQEKDVEVPPNGDAKLTVEFKPD